MKSLIDGKEVLGTVVFMYGSSIVTQACKYAGDTDLDVYMRARSGLEVLDRDKLPHLPHALPKFYALGS